MAALAVIWAPVRALARVAEERRVLLGFGVVALYALLRLVVAAVDVLGGVTAGAFQTEDFPSLPPDVVESVAESTGVTTILSSVLSPFIGWAVVSLLMLSSVLSPFIGWAVVSLLMQLVTRFFGGTGPLSGMFAVVGVAAVPLVILTAITIPATGLQAVAGPDSPATAILDLLLLLLTIAAYAWNIALIVIGAALARRIGYGQSAGSCAISCAGVVGLIILIALVIGVLIAVLVGAVGSPGSP